MRLLLHLIISFIALSSLLNAQTVKETKFVANDWFSKFEFSYLESNDAKNVKNVIVFLDGFIASRKRGPKQILNNPEWKKFAEENNIALVSLSYKYSLKVDKRKGERPLPFFRKYPAEAERLRNDQLFSQIKAQFPNVEQFGFIGGANACSASISKVKKTAFWIARNAQWISPKKPYHQSMGLLISSNQKLSSKLLDINSKNREEQKRITFIELINDKEKAQETKMKLNAFIKAYIISAFDDPGAKGVVLDLYSKEESRNTVSKKQRGRSTWLPHQDMIEGWKALHEVTEQKTEKGIRQEQVETGIPKQPYLNLYLKLPSRDGKEVPPQGVLCVVTWLAQENSILDILDHKLKKDELINWADENEYAVIMWNTVTLWDTGVGHADLDKKTAKAYGHRFDDMARSWKKGMNRLVARHDIPAAGYFMFGMSRGSHWGHRLVLRAPEYFQAAHFHVANSYDIPTSKASNLLWLITTGERDSGCMASLAFYKECNELGYPISIKSGPGLGHGSNRDIEKLGMAFFDYAHELKIELKDDDTSHQELGLLMSDRMREDISKSQYVGDFINQGVYTLEEADWIPAAQKIPLWSDPIRYAWDETTKGSPAK